MNEQDQATISSRLREGLSWIIAFAILAGPPLLSIGWLVVRDKPLLTVETVTVTRPTGAIFDVLGVLLVWVIILIVIAYMYVGPRP